MRRFIASDELKAKIESLCGFHLQTTKNGWTNIDKAHLIDACEKLCKALSDDKERVPIIHAFWEKALIYKSWGGERCALNGYRCSNCRTEFVEGIKYRYCPHCGARMEKQERRIYEQ